MKSYQRLRTRYNLPKKEREKMIIYEESGLYVEKEQSEIPWLKIFTKEPFVELGDVPKELRTRLWEVFDVIEHEMREYYNPKKINMASFANMLPRVHIHVMARFENDSYFPNPMWGEKLREAKLNLPDEEEFLKRVKKALDR
ncbi:MAG: hypothetical protein QG560_671 [Campylobacterota bacterium]|nr:hypothetical protein [Campylobacterota bacterium]